MIAQAFMYKLDGIFRDHYFKNGKYHDEIICSLLENEYRSYKENGLYEMKQITRRIIDARKNKNHGFVQQ